MRVALDVSALDPDFRAHAVRGTGRYVSELYKGLPKSSTSSFRYSAVGKGGIVDKCIDLLPAGRTTLKHQVAYPFSLCKEVVGDVDLLHFPYHGDAPSWSRFPYVVTVLDLIPLVFKELYAPKINNLRFKFARWLELQAIRNATLVMVISEHTGKDVHRLLGVPWERIVVTPLGVSEEMFALPQSKEEILRKADIPLDRKFILYVGGIDQRKNIEFLLRAYKGVLDQEVGEDRSPPRLIMAGNISSDAEYPKFKKIVEDFGIGDDVYEAGYVTDDVLIALYQQSELFFYPSLYEGFGLPPLEAMRAGTPVVCSNTSSIPEVVGDSALLFSPTDIDDAVTKLLVVLKDSELSTELVGKGREQAKKFTWEKTVEKTLAGYQQAEIFMKDAVRSAA